MPDISQIETFVLTHELGSLAAAGRKLNISAAAVSKQLTRLEEELKVQLMLRTTRSIELTEVGQLYYLQCKRILEEMAAASDVIHHTKTIPHGPLKVVSGRHFAKQFILPHLSEFLTAYPQITLDLELAERIPDISAEDIDVVIGMSVPVAGNAIQKRIATTRYCLCGSKQYFQEQGTPKKISDLKHHRYITHSMRRPDNEILFRNKESVAIVPYLKVNDVDAMIQLALDGMGLINVHEYAVHDLLKQDALSEILVNETLKDVPLYAAYAERKFVPSKVRKFIDFVCGHIYQT